MNISLPQRAKRIKPSATLAIMAKAKEMKEQGIDILSLSAGEPDCDTPEHIKTEAIHQIKSGFTKYTATSGIPELKKAICEKLQKDNKLAFLPENILVSSGAKQALYNLIAVLVDKGDEVLLTDPCWVSYEEMVKLAEGSCIFLPTNEYGKITAEIIEQKITPKTKVLILNSPSNPTGVVYTQKNLEEIAKVCLKYNIFVISDEIYEKLIYDVPYYSIAQVSEAMKKQTAVVNGVSKAYSMTGWRIGYAAAEKEIITAASALQGHTTANPNSIAQKAAVAAIAGPQECIEEMKKIYKERRDYILQRLNKIEGVSAQKPDGAFYIFPDMSEIMKKKNMSTTAEFCDKLLSEKQVAVIPGSAFGANTCIRISYAADIETIRKALDRIEAFITE